jgi:hypothetical protein
MKEVMIYKIRVILNAEEDVIREVAIDASASLEDLHNALTNAFGFVGNEMASFFKSDDTWVQGEEFPLFDMSEGLDKKTQMSELEVKDVLTETGDKLLYIYDFFNMWSFFVELIDEDFDHKDPELPALLFSLGLIPTQAPEIQFETDDLLDEDFDEDLYREIDGDIEDMNFN